MDVLPERVVRRVNARCIGKYDTPQSTKLGTIYGDFYDLGIVASLIRAGYGPPFRRGLTDVEINAWPKIPTARSGLPRGRPVRLSPKDHGIVSLEWVSALDVMLEPHGGARFRRIDNLGADAARRELKAFRVGPGGVQGRCRERGGACRPSAGSGRE